MPFQIDTVTLTLIVLCAAFVLGILVYIVSVRIKARRQHRDVAAIRAVIVDYFRRSGVAVSVECTECGDDGLLTVLVESEPMKRFRLSHIIEMTLREHVRKSCGLELDRIYWRFPIKEAAQAATAPDQAARNNGGDKQGAPETPDEYINEGLENYRHIPRTEVTELPWETFEEMSTIARDSKNEKPE